MSTPNAIKPNSAAPRAGHAWPETFEGTARALQAQFASAVAIPQAVLGANLSLLSELLTFMGQRMRAQATVFLITHDLNTLDAACERIVALARGKLIADGSAATLIASDDPWLQSYFQGPRGRTIFSSEAQAPYLQKGRDR